MGYKIQKTLPTTETVLSKLPLSAELTTKVAQDRKEIEDILSGKDNRKIMIIGPCSAWKKESVKDFAKELKAIEAEVSDVYKLVMRVYIQKPRTTVGWMGPVNQPDPFADADLEAGTYYCREMMIDVLQEGLPIADEALFTHNDAYFTDLLSWLAIGARSTEDQEHRIFASMIPIPIGMKNPTSGNIPIGINSIIAAQHSHVFAFHGNQIQTTGNEYAHLILRGGDGTSNYDTNSIEEAAGLMKAKNINNPGIIVDLSHDNCIDPETGKKDPLRQPFILDSVIKSMEQSEQAKDSVKGFMAESFFLDGNQNATAVSSADELKSGLSITDPCLGIEKTKKMLIESAEKLRNL